MQTYKDKSLIRLYCAGFLMLVCLPVIFVYAYDQLAGGLLNCFMAGRCKQGFVDGRVITTFVAPGVTSLVYGWLIYSFIKARAIMRGKLHFILAWTTLIVCGIFTCIIILWPALT